MAINPNQTLNTARTQAGFEALLASLGVGASAAYNNWVANMRLDWRTPQTETFRREFPLVSQEVLSRIADGSAQVAGISASSAQTILGGNLSVPPAAVVSNAAAAMESPAVTLPPAVVEAIKPVQDVVETALDKVEGMDVQTKAAILLAVGVVIYKLSKG